jgi:hypothetical protein
MMAGLADLGLNMNCGDCSRAVDDDWPTVVELQFSGSRLGE